MTESTWKKLTGILTVTQIITLLGFVVSIQACQISQKTLQTSKSNFILENRPRIIITPSKFENIDSFLDISTNGKWLLIRQKYRLTNIGKQPAQNMFAPMAVELKGRFKQNMPIEVISPPPLTLLPGNSWDLSVNLNLEIQTDSREDVIDALLTKGIPCEVGVLYSSDLTPNT